MFLTQLFFKESEKCDMYSPLKRGYFGYIIKRREY